MKVDKRKGKYDLFNASTLDDVAYSIYIDVSKKRFKKYSIIRTNTQREFILYLDLLNKGYQIDFYKEATILIRTDKINKIISKR